MWFFFGYDLFSSWGLSYIHTLEGATLEPLGKLNKPNYGGT